MIHKRKIHQFRIFLIQLVIVLSGKYVNSFKILGVSISSMKSHHAFFSAIMKGLADDGNNVTFISPFESSTSIQNLREIRFDNPIDINNSKGTDRKLGLNVDEAVQIMSLFRPVNSFGR